MREAHILTLRMVVGNRLAEVSGSSRLESLDGEEDDRKAEGKGDRKVDQDVQYLVLATVFIEFEPRTDGKPDRSTENEA